MDIAIGAICCINIDRYGVTDGQYQERSAVDWLILRADRKLG
ncbi:MAG TPA: hypothetical protein VL242_22265 [Sorangium sp.]|nr:hypothetical protein [Sorangium sp.]